MQFQIGDRVRIKGTGPAAAYDTYRHRTGTIVSEDVALAYWRDKHYSLVTSVPNRVWIKWDIPTALLNDVLHIQSVRIVDCELLASSELANEAKVHKNKGSKTSV